MTWREELRTVVIGGRKFIGASFRGVPFFVESAERTGGRRAVVHEFPLRDDPFVEDLGRRARGFRLDGYVLGDNYLSQRDDLLAALEDTEGPGELVLPFYQRSLHAICVNLAVRETRADGGMAVFALEFAEAPAQGVAPTIAVDAPGEIAAAADAARAAVKAELLEKFDTDGLPAFARDSAETSLRGAAERLGAKLAPAVDLPQELAALDAQIRSVTARTASLVSQPADLIDAFAAAITGLGDTARNAPAAVLDALLDAYDIDPGQPVPETTPTRQRERANQLALAGALQRTIAIEAARLAPRVRFSTLEEAIAARDRIAAQLEEQAAGAGDTAYPVLVMLRAQVLRAVPGTAVLARVVTVTRRMPIPSLLLAYQLYGSVDQEEDIIKRNNIRHPGFCVGDLKVISNG